MLRNYFNIALRSLKRNLVYSFINLTGLSIGIACTMLIMLWVYDELSFNKNFSNYDNIHQIKLNIGADNGVITGSLVPYPLKNELQQDTRIKRTCITIGQSALLSVGDKKIRTSGYDASEAFLEMFDFKVIHGRRDEALNDLMSIVLTRSTAVALFGTDDVVGNVVSVKIENTEDLKVTAVVEDPPANCSLGFKFILPFSYFERTAPWLSYAKDNWSNNSFNMFAELQPGVTRELVDLSIKDLIDKKNIENKNAELFLHPMSRWRLYDDFENGKEAGGLIDYVIMFSCIGIFILVMACINFMNLATARSQQRAREVGIRKSIGSTRRQLIFQFIGESIFMAAVSLVAAIVIVEAVLPLYNAMVGKALLIDFTSGMFWIFSMGLILITGIFAGIYPAFYLSAFKPAKILKGSVHGDKKGGTPRQILVIVQNTFSILLPISTLSITPIIVQRWNHISTC